MTKMKIKKKLKCKHPKDKIRVRYYTPFGEKSHWYKCDCGVKLEPIKFKVIE